MHHKSTQEEVSSQVKPMLRLVIKGHQGGSSCSVEIVELLQASDHNLACNHNLNCNHNLACNCNLT